MSFYEIVYLATNPIFLLTTDKFFCLFFDKKNGNGKMRHLLFFFYFFALSAIVFMNVASLAVFLLNIVFLVLIAWSYHAPLQKKMISISFIAAIHIVIELVTGTALGVFSFDDVPSSAFESAPLLILIRTITMIVAHFLQRYHNRLKTDYPISPSYYILFFSVLFGTMYLFISQLDNANLTIQRISCCGGVLIGVNLIMILVDEKIYRGMISEHEKELLAQQTAAYETQLQTINESMHAIKVLKHDFQNHFIILSNLCENKKTNEMKCYIDAILENRVAENISNSGNFVIDSILNFKLNKLVHRDIEISLEIMVPVTINIAPYDMTCILSNLIDNAVTAVEDAKEKRLRIQIHYKIKNLMIAIQNTYKENLMEENGVLQTTKEDKLFHGLGLTIVKKTVEKHQGTVRIQHSENWFSAHVILPC